MEDDELKAALERFLAALETAADALRRMAELAERVEREAATGAETDK